MIDPRENGSIAPVHAGARGGSAVLGGRFPRERTARSLWPYAVVGLLSAHAAVWIWLARVASADRSFAVEPQYYERALAWDRTQAERQAGEALGWDVKVEGGAGKGSAADRPGVTLRLASRAGTMLDGARVDVIAFHQALASERHGGQMLPRGDGVYVIDAPMVRRGLWEVRFEITRGPDRFAGTRVVEVGATPGGTP